MVLFLDKEARYGGSAIEPLVGDWAKNADEYICWDVIPKQALVKFVSCDSMTENLAPEKMFLRTDFRETKSLPCFRQKARVVLSVDGYAQRISLLLCDIMHELSPNTKGDQLIEYLFATLCDLYHWGYHVDDDKHYLDRKVSAENTAELTRCSSSTSSFQDSLDNRGKVELKDCKSVP